MMLRRGLVCILVALGGSSLMADLLVCNDTRYARFEGFLNPDEQVATSRDLIRSQELISLADGQPASLGTLMTDLATDGTTIPLFYARNIIVPNRVNKGGRDLPQEQFTVAPTATLGDFIAWLEDVLGITTLAHDPTLKDLTAEGIPFPGVTLVHSPEAAIEIVSNVGERNQFDLPWNSLAVLPGEGFPPVNPYPFVWITFDRANGGGTSTGFRAYNSAFEPIDIDVTFVLEDKFTNNGTTWRYFAESQDDADIDRVVGTGLIHFDPYGNYIAGEAPVIRIDHAGTDILTPQLITLDFSPIRCLGSISMSWWYGWDNCPMTQEFAFGGDLNGAGTAATTRSQLTSQVLYDTVVGVGHKATASTLLVDLINGNGVRLFNDGNVIVLAQARKGEDDLPDETFIIGTHGNTLGEFIAWLEDVLGITTLAHDPMLPVLVSSPMPGVTVNANGQISIVGNIGRVNDITLDSDAIEVVSGNGIDPPSCLPFIFTKNESATGESIRTSIRTYDSLLIAENIDITLVMQDKDNQGITWRFFAESSDDSDTDRVVGTGLIYFNTGGNFDSATNVGVVVDRIGVGSLTPHCFMLNFETMDGFAMFNHIEPLTECDCGETMNTLYLLGIDGAIHPIDPNDSIQQTINEAYDRDQIRLAPGTYYENLTCAKELAIIGVEGPEHTVIDGGRAASVVTHGPGSQEEGKTLQLDGLTLTHGYSSYGGGLNCLSQGHVVLSRCYVLDNQAILGGGVSLGDHGEMTMKNVLLTGNIARKGGAIYSSPNSDILLENCTVSQNGDTSSSSYGGGFYGDKGVLKMMNGILWDNHAGTGPEAYLRNGATLRCYYGDLPKDPAAVRFDPLSSFETFAVIHEDPCFADPQGGDFHLRSEGWRWDPAVGTTGGWAWDEVTSRCIDAGNPATSLQDEPVTFSFDPENEFGVNLRIDIGAYGGTSQASMAPWDWALRADINNDGTEDLMDYAQFAKEWSETETSEYRFGDFGHDGVLSVIDLSLLAEEWLAKTSWR